MLSYKCFREKVAKQFTTVRKRKNKKNVSASVFSFLVISLGGGKCTVKCTVCSVSVFLILGGGKCTVNDGGLRFRELSSGTSKLDGKQMNGKW